jgi:hypothetical protein
MRNAEEFSGQQSGLTRVPPTYGEPESQPVRPKRGRIRYARRGPAPRVEPLCTLSQGAFAHLGGDDGVRGAGEVAHAGEVGDEAWSARFPVTGRHNDMWVLVCGGIAAAAAFAAAFVASGGVASHPATPSAVPAVVSAACPSPAP